MSDATTAALPSERQPAAERTLWGEPLRRLIVVALGFLIAAAALTLPATLHVDGMSIYDEATHADYAYQMAHGHVPGRGSILAPQIRAEVVCRGAARSPHPDLPHCGEKDPSVSLFGARGEDYNFTHPPLYYFITGVIARVAEQPFSGLHFITFARAVGVLWIFAAMLVLYLGLRRFAVDWRIATCAGVLLPCMPALMYASATVTNDAGAALGGALSILVLARVLIERKLGWIVPAVITALVAATKIINALPLLVAAVLFLITALFWRRTDREAARKLTVLPLTMIGGFALVYFGWSEYQKHRGVPHWKSPIAGISTRDIHGLPFSELFGTTFQSNNVLGSGFLPPQLDNAWATILLRACGVLGVGAMIALLLMHERFTPRFMVGAVATLGTLSFPLVVEVQDWVSSHHYFPAVPARYGLAYASVLVGAIAIAADDKKLRKSLYVFTTFAVGVMAYTVYNV